MKSPIIGMYKNIMEESNNLRGEFGELVIKHHIKGSFRTREKKWDYLDKIFSEKRIKAEWYEFLNSHWPTFDVVRFQYDENKAIKGVEIYEVKTRKYYRAFNPRFNTDDFTMNSADVCKRAKELGMDVYLARIILFDNWRISVNIVDFDESRIRIDPSCDRRWHDFLEKSIMSQKASRGHNITE